MNSSSNEITADVQNQQVNHASPAMVPEPPGLRKLSTHDKGPSRRSSHELDDVAAALLGAALYDGASNGPSLLKSATTGQAFSSTPLRASSFTIPSSLNSLSSPAAPTFASSPSSRSSSGQMNGNVMNTHPMGGRSVGGPVVATVQRRNSSDNLMNPCIAADVNDVTLAHSSGTIGGGGYHVAEQTQRRSIQVPDAPYPTPADWCSADHDARRHDGRPWPSQHGVPFDSKLPHRQGLLSPQQPPQLPTHQFAANQFARRGPQHRSSQTADPFQPVPRLQNSGGTPYHSALDVNQPPRRQYRNLVYDTSRQYRLNGEQG